MSLSNYYESRYAVGIDLGTTNCSVSYVDFDADICKSKIFNILQLTEAGESQELPLLPSFCYLPEGHELPVDSLKLPWSKADESVAVGTFARKQGMLVSERLVSSAKSWLAHSGVNRRNNILPWGSQLGQQNISPLKASFLYLEHIRNAWDYSMGTHLDKEGAPCCLADQNVIITIPASFDETARTLTAEAASLAGFKHFTLLEEPLAAFYSWLGHHEKDWQNIVPAGSRILVVDVGGGTTDLSLIEVDENGVLHRTAVGEHLLLGGDNMDMALVKNAEEHWKSRLSQRQWYRACQECRQIKELLLSDNAPDTATFELTGTGSSLFAGLKKITFSQENVQKLIVDGFFPRLPVTAPSPERRTGLREMGLPYASEPAVTSHILAFLRRKEGFIKPSHVLFNGGTMLPECLRERVLDTIGDWNDGVRPIELVSSDLSLAVAEGASCYALARSGRSARVKGGIAKSYYLKIASGEESRLLCIMSRDTEAEIVNKIDCGLHLRTNQPVVFPLYESATRLGDKPGDIIDEDDSVTVLPSLNTVIKLGKKSSDVPVSVSAMLNAIGILELNCQAEGKTFPLVFDLNGDVQTVSKNFAGEAVEIAIIDKACTVVKEFFCQNIPEGSIVKKLEKILETERTSWNVYVLRKLSDYLLDNADWRLKSPEHEQRWLNLCGFCMRPGFGFAGDEWRMAECWKLWFKGVCFPKKQENVIQWHVFWRRIAAGLKVGQQGQIISSFTKLLINADGSNAIRANDQSGLELWCTAASLENIQAQKKLKMAQVLVNGRMNDRLFWCVGRLLARRPFHAGWDTVVPSENVEKIVPDLISRCIQAGCSEMAFFALANSTSMTGMRTIDVSEKCHGKVLDFLAKSKSAEKWKNLCEHVADKIAMDAETVFGEELPLGLSLDLNN